MTLLALTLSVGFVVDDAIVMLENIIRHIEHGMRPYEAALKGARESASPAVITLLIASTPVAHHKGEQVGHPCPKDAKTTVGSSLHRVLRTRAQRRGSGVTDGNERVADIERYRSAARCRSDWLACV